MVDWKKLKDESLLDRKRFYVVISGDKSFKKDDFIIAIISGNVVPTPAQDILRLVSDKLLCKAREKYSEIKVITGDNSGADSLAIEYAISNDFNVLKYEADWDGKGSKAGFERNEEMLLKAGMREHKAAILFWDGEDYMTRNLIYQAWNYAVPLRVYNYRAKRVLTKEEIYEIQMEEKQKQIQYRGY